MIRYVLIILLIASGISCSENNTVYSHDSQMVKIGFEDVLSINDANLIDSIQIIDLECNIVIGGINRVIQFDKYIYIMDSQKTQTVLIFDNSGKFINSISDIGNGPNEYAQLTDILINPLDSSLNLISRMDRKILKYGLDGRQVLSVENLPKSFKQFFKTKNGYVGYMGNFGDGQDKSKNISTLSDDLEIENSYFDIDPTWESLSFGTGYAFSSYNEITHYIEPMDFNIYTIDEEKISVPYYFDLGKLAWPQDVKEYEPVKELLDKDRNRYIQRIYDFQETENYLIIHILYQGQKLLGIYNKQTKESFVSHMDAYIGDYFIPFGDMIGFGNNTIYTLVDADAMQRIAIGKDDYNDFEAEYPEQIKKLRSKFPNIKDDGNPFLIIYYIK